MSDRQSPPPSGAGVEGSADWPKARMVLLALLALGLFGLVAAVLGDWFGVAASPVARDDDLFILLAPFVAIAVAIERFWEIAFNAYESFAMATARLLGVSGGTTRWMRDEARNAEEALKTLARELADKTPTDKNYHVLSTAFHLAEVRLLEAQARIEEALKAPEYVAVKRAITLLGSLLIGVLISVTGGLTLLNVAGFAVPIPVDVLVTGLLIGSGPGPLHSLIGTLQELRNAVAGLAELARGSAIKRMREPTVERETTLLGQVRTRTGRPFTIATVAENVQGPEAPPSVTVTPQQLASATTLREHRQVRQALRFR